MIPRAPFSVHIEFNVPATMRDGTVLRANVYRPDDGGAGSYPVLLTRLPYGKDLPLGSSALDPVQTARRGYIVVVQDVRGTFTSGGEWLPFQHEELDGADTVAWAASLPGANGLVGMYGASYFGFTQWAALKQHPEALRAMAPMITWDDPNDGVITRDGVLELGLVASWNLQGGFDQLARRHRSDPQALGIAMYRLAHELDNLPQRGYRELPIENFGPLSRLDLGGPVNSAIEQASNAELSEHTSAAHAYTADLPVLHIGGWYDIFLNGTIRNFLNMRARGNVRQHLLIGPWTHGRVDHVVGDLDFGVAAWGAMVDLRADLMTTQLQFFDRWLKDIPNGFDSTPAVKYFVMGANVWKSSDSWPPAGVVEQPWYLHSGGRANGADGDGFLSRERPGAESPDRYVYDPGDPVPTVGGALLMHPILRAGPRDQRDIESRTDLLSYTSAPAEQPVEVSGRVIVNLYVATDAPDTDFVARLIDVHPDGRAITLTDGITRMRHRNGLDALSEPVHADQTYRIQVDLWSTANVFLPGHRIRLDVTSSNFPRWERNLNTGADNARTTDMRSASQTILHDEAHPSYIVLPVVPA